MGETQDCIYSVTMAERISVAMVWILAQHTLSLCHAGIVLHLLMWTEGVSGSISISTTSWNRSNVLFMLNTILLGSQQTLLFFVTDNHFTMDSFVLGYYVDF